MEQSLLERVSWQVCKQGDTAIEQFYGTGISQDLVREELAVRLGMKSFKESLQAQAGRIIERGLTQNVIKLEQE